MNEISGANKFKFDSFPKQLKIKETETTKSYEIANERNKFFTRTSPNLTHALPSANDLESYEIKIEVFERAFKPLKRNKSIGDDNINFNIILLIMMK